jgi:hypothetical protein
MTKEFVFVHGMSHGDTGHGPMLSAPDELVKILRAC